MREICATEITKAVADLCIAANCRLPIALETALRGAPEQEESEIGRAILRDLAENLTAAKEMQLPICQDTGMAVVFAEVGQEVHIVGDFAQAIHAGVREGYEKGYLRSSVVKDPLRRKNTEDNTPAVLHTSLIPGDKIHLLVAPKGFGSENMSRIKMLNPSASREDIIHFVTETVRLAGGNACPPMVLGVGIGGDFELCAYLAKKALCRSVSQRNQDPYYGALEADLLKAVNATGIGPQGFGGSVTALCVNVEEYPTHIAGLPVAVNVGCHVTRHKEIII